MTGRPVDDERGERLRYRLLTGPDDAAFCERVSRALDEGYRLHGAPTLTFDGTRLVAAQAVVLDEAPQGPGPAGLTGCSSCCSPTARVDSRRSGRLT